MKEIPGDIIILGMCTINDNHMMYGSWDTKCNGQNFLSYRPFFALLPPSQPEKPKFWKNKKNVWRYYHFTHMYHKWRSYDVWLLRYGVGQTELFVVLGHFLPFHPFNKLENQNLEKMKTFVRDIILHIYIKNHNHLMYSSWYTQWDRKFFVILRAIFSPLLSPPP